MAFSTLWQWLATAASNTEVDGITLSNSMTPTQIDDSIREVMSQVAAATAKGSNVASATTTTLGDGWFFHITGTTTITDIDFTDAKDGRFAILEFDGILTLTHNSTTLVCPGGANITTAAGDTAIIVQDSSDNIHVVAYQRATRRPSGWELVGTATPSAAASQAFTGLSAYRMLRLSGHVVPATDAVSFIVRTSVDNGSNYAASSGDYFAQYVRGTSTTVDGAHSSTITSMTPNFGTIGNLAAEGVTFDFLITQWNQAANCLLTGTMNVVATDGTLIVGTVAGKRISTTARDAIQLLFSSGNIASGYVQLDGMRG